MSGARFKWTNEQSNGCWWVHRRVWPFWEPVTCFIEKDAVKGRQRCEEIIEHHAKSKVVTFYYDGTGRQLPGFNIE